MKTSQTTKYLLLKCLDTQDEIKGMLVTIQAPLRQQTNLDVQIPYAASLQMLKFQW